MCVGYQFTICRACMWVITLANTPHSPACAAAVEGQRSINVTTN